MAVQYKSLLLVLSRFEQQKAALVSLRLDFDVLMQRAIHKGKGDRAEWLKGKITEADEALRLVDQEINNVEVALTDHSSR